MIEKEIIVDNKELFLFLEEFEFFCTDRMNSNKGVSYKLAIKYLCEFLGIKIMNQDAYELILKTRSSLQYESSDLYKELLMFLSRRRQRSYLEKGFIHAAINQLILFERKQ